MKSGSSQRDIGVQARSEVRVGENHGENRGEHRGSRQGGLMKSGEVGSSDFKGWRQINQCWTARWIVAKREVGVKCEFGGLVALKCWGRGSSRRGPKIGWGSATAVGRNLAQEGFGKDVGWMRQAIVRMLAL